MAFQDPQHPTIDEINKHLDWYNTSIKLLADAKANLAAAQQLSDQIWNDLWSSEWTKQGDLRRPRADGPATFTLKPVGMKVHVFGPNLRAEVGMFHVHAVDCADCKNYGPGRKFGGDTYGEISNASKANTETVLEAFSRKDCTTFVYPEGDFDYDYDLEGGGYEGDLKFFPCVGGLK